MKKKNLIKLFNVCGHVENDDEVIVFVTKKYTMPRLQKLIDDPRTRWKKKDIIPKEVKIKTRVIHSKKKPTKVIEVGHVMKYADRMKYRPLKGGCEIGLKDENFVGTAGCLVTIEKFKNLYLVGIFSSFKRILERFGLPIEKKVYVWTNSHVVSKSVLRPERGISVVQPGISREDVGKTDLAILIRRSSINEFDDALIELEEKNISNSIIKIGKPTGISDVQKGESVEKYGRTTGYTTGKCLYKNATIQIDYGSDGILNFSGLDYFSDMSAPGDSGSVIVRKKDKKVVSHLFAGSNVATFGIPAKKVQQKLGFELYNN